MPRQPRYFTDKEQKTIKKLYHDEGLGLAKTARALHCGIDCLRDHLAGRGLLRSTAETYKARAKKQEKVVDAKTRKLVVKLYRAGKKMGDIMAECNFGQMVIVRVLLEEGIEEAGNYYAPNTHTLNALRGE